MIGMMRIAVGAALVVVSSAAMAERVQGSVVQVDGNRVTLKASDGATLKMTLTPDVAVIAVIKASMADLKEGTFIGSAALPQPDGTQKAVEVHIFPESMRGVGEGHRPYAPVAGGTMTNGASTGPTVASVDGTTLVVKYKGGEKKIVVPPGVPIVRYEIGSPADLKPGAGFTVLNGTRNADGTLDATRINVGRDGVVPQ
jgi:hypothetical protein